MNADFIRQLPKAELHVHLDGSLRLQTLIELAQQQKVELPSYTQEGMRELVYKKDYKDLQDYLRGFTYAIRVLQDAESIERGAYEFALDVAADGVCYVEARFAPHHHINERLGYADIFQAVNKGFLRAKKEINIKYPDRPAFTYGLIACIMRFFRPEYGSYYKALASVLPKTSLVGLGVAAANDLVAALVEIKNKQGIPIVAVDLAGSEDGNPARPFQEVFSLARQNGIELTVHAGEAYGAESIFDAVMRLNAARIGHGYELFNKEMILDKVSDKKKYINILAQDMSQRTITCEMCLTSNSQTNPAMRDLKNHPIMQFVHAGIPVMLNTDNRLVSNTTLTNEYQIFSELFKPSIRLLRRMIMTGFHASFYPGTSNDKHKYVKQVVYALDEKLAQFAPGK